MSFANGTSTSVFLSCTTPPPAGGIATVTGTQTVFTTVYSTVLQAACPTSQWMATYTITETCTGNQAAYTPAAIPPGFVVTTVKCDACKPTSDVVITCPGLQPTLPPGALPTVTVQGNGVTASVTASPVGAPGMGGMGGNNGGAVPPVTAVAGGNGNGSGPGAGAAAGAGAGAAAGAGAGAGAGSVPASNANSSPKPGSGAGGNKNGTTSTPLVAVTNNGPSVKKTSMTLAGLALAAAPFILL
ncbi:hypothetical protein PG997_013893 [Apiospora hydei]|uniref:Uncharacterized protein n=1 Tax=Apiospora hydei TaxID=1337664 RepID=A0ABR1VA26_9PEZI